MSLGTDILEPDDFDVCYKISVPKLKHDKILQLRLDFESEGYKVFEKRTHGKVEFLACHVMGEEDR